MRKDWHHPAMGARTIARRRTRDEVEHDDFARTREFVRGVLRAEKARRNLTYPQLSRMLADYGIDQSATNLSTKVHRGMMSAQLFVAILAVMGIESLDLLELAIARKGM